MRTTIVFALALSACGGVGTSSEAPKDLRGEAEFALEQVPAGVGCLRVQATGASRTEKRSFDVQPGAQVAQRFSGLPTGVVHFTGDALDTSCARAADSAVPTWLADGVDADLAAGSVAQVKLLLRKNGSADVTVDFVDEPICVRGDLGDTTRGAFAPPAAGAIICGAGGSRTHSLEVTQVPSRNLIFGLHQPLDGPMADKLPPPPPTVPFGGDDNLYSGIWLAGNYGAASWFTTSWQEFTQQWDSFQQQGLRMHDFETFTVGGQRVYAGIFHAGTDASAAWFTSDWNDFTSKWAAFEAQGLRMHDFETFIDNGTRVWVGIFRAGTDARAAWFTSDWNDFQQHWADFEARGLRMHDLEVFEQDGHLVYAGIFREGTGGHAAWITSDWSDFVSKWGSFEQSGLRLLDFESWLDGGKRVYAGVFLPGSGARAAWIGVDWESFVSKWHDLDSQGVRLNELETWKSACPAKCLNQLVMPQEAGTDPMKGLYDYWITGSSTHCEGLPGTCGNGAAGVVYHQPVERTPQGRYVRFSGVSPIDPIFTLPFKDAKWHNGWLYSIGNWHHAVDYSIAGDTSFNILAAAPGRVVHTGWDVWSGNTVVVSHDVGDRKDVYRTIHMHARNGAHNDCNNAWTQTYELNKTADWAPHYKYFLEQTGCTKDPAGRTNLDPTRWGTDSDSLVAVGSTVARGGLLAHAGSTGPGGCGCIPKDPATAAIGDGGTGPNTHLHIFFAKRDPTDSLWYFFDPYGMYAPAECYPAGMTDALPAACARYPVAWKDGKPQLPQ